MSGVDAFGSGAAGWLARGLLAACFLGGAVLAVSGRLVVAGGAFLAAHTVLAAAAVLQGQRQRGAGLSLLGLGWFGLSAGLAATNGAAAGLPATPLFAIGAGLVGIGGLLTTGLISFNPR
jgi:hypothetical protein